MKANMFKTVGAAVVLVGGISGTSLAHAVIVTDDLGHNPGNVDVWRLECPARTVKAQANVHDLDPDKVHLGVAVVRPSGSPVKADFRVAPDGTGPSSPFADDVSVPAAADTFFVLIVKDKASNPAGAEVYSSHMECKDANGVDIGTVDPTPVQDE